MEALLEVVSPSSVASFDAEAWPQSAATPAAFVAEPDGEPLAALIGDTLSPRFCSWRGASGRRYIVSVYDGNACPPYCDAVVIAVAVSTEGRRRALAVADTGVFPEPLIARLRSLAPAGERTELHLHLLAASSAERRATLDDLAAAAPHAARS